LFVAGLRMFTPVVACVTSVSASGLGTSTDAEIEPVALTACPFDTSIVPLAVMPVSVY
jgi:hypothetical protein